MTDNFANPTDRRQAAMRKDAQAGRVREIEERIAAAPEILGALREAQMLCGPDLPVYVQQKIRAAILKATGGQP